MDGVVEGRRPTVLVVEDETSMMMTFEAVLKPSCRLLKASCGREALEYAAKERIDIAIVDIGLPGGMDGIEVIRQLKATQPSLEAIVCSVCFDVPTVVEAMRAGAIDYHVKDFGMVGVLPSTIERAVARRRERLELARLRTEQQPAAEIVGAARPPMSGLLGMLERAAVTESPILLRGESGVGKTTLARWIHQRSSRSQGPFIRVNLAALPAATHPSVLFGAHGPKGGTTVGTFEEAERGTLFLAGIDRLAAEAQEAVARVLATRQAPRASGPKDVPLDVRVVASTSVNLTEAVNTGRFSKALHDVLAQLQADVPALRTRRDDIPELLKVFVSRHCARTGRPPLHLSPEVLAALMAHDWPANLRELENLVERLVTLLPGPDVSLSDLPPEYRLGEAERRGGRHEGDASHEEIMDSIEKALVMQAIRKGNNVWKRAAELMGLKYSSFLYKLDKHKLR